MKKSDWINIIGKKRVYSKNFDGDEVIKWEVLNLHEKQDIVLRFISKNSDNRQGIFIGFLGCEGTIDIEVEEKKDFYKGGDFWEDVLPKELKLTCKSNDGLLSIYNIYERKDEKPKINGLKTRYSQMDFQGMKVEQNGRVYRYYCNHATKDSPFDALVFEIELL